MFWVESMHYFKSMYNGLTMNEQPIVPGDHLGRHLEFFKMLNDANLASLEF